MTPPRPLTPAQQQLVAIALKRAATVELALGDEEAAGRRLLSYLSESRAAQASGPGPELVRT